MPAIRATFHRVTIRTKPPYLARVRRYGNPSKEPMIILVHSIENLAHLCQRCHLRHDIKEHVENARRTRESKRLKTEPTLFQI